MTDRKFKQTNYILLKRSNRMFYVIDYLSVVYIHNLGEVSWVNVI